MTYARDSFESLPRMPAWITSAGPETPEDVAFLSGAGLAHLHLVITHSNMPQCLLRARLALRAAEAVVTQSGRPERAGDLRDALAFLAPGDSAGPAGDIYRAWMRAVERPVSVQALHRALPDIDAEEIAFWLDAGQGAPVARAASVLQAVIADRPKEPATALILADAALAHALGWRHAVPILVFGLKPADLQKTDADLRLACHRAVSEASAVAMREAADLARRAERLRAVAPKLRAKGSDEAVNAFLTRDAVAPSALTSLRSDRAARRFCDRLVELGVVCELTGRDTFRLYGV